MFAMERERDSEREREREAYRDVMEEGSGREQGWGRKRLEERTEAGQEWMGVKEVMGGRV